MAAGNPAIRVVIQGDTGTGKTASAHELHRMTNLPVQAMRVADGATAGDPIFLHEWLSVHAAHRPSTLLIEELGDFSEKSQAVIASLLDTERRGSGKTLTHWVFTSRQPCDALLRAGQLRQDLYFRLGSFTVDLPKLSERLDDIPILVQHFIDLSRSRNESAVTGVAPHVLEVLRSYSWPGNVRELENAIHFACAVAGHSSLEREHLPPALLNSQNVPVHTSSAFSEHDSGLKEMVEQYEKDIIVDALSRTHGNVAAASRELQTTQRILGYKIKKYGITP